MSERGYCLTHALGKHSWSANSADDLPGCSAWNGPTPRDTVGMGPKIADTDQDAMPNQDGKIKISASTSNCNTMKGMTPR